ncbi:hypothetical protein [uncultured Bosea sp.]|uniref:hypothetical protein n=1 Tax=uncultured Bosea sp. TaxID=211457 RepID=UPI00263B3353|nr:hypothetical protein [uncultured Bosea sp.]
MDEREPHHVIVERLITEARLHGYLYELKRQLAAIDGRPTPDTETHLSPPTQPRPRRRKPKGSDR